MARFPAEVPVFPDPENVVFDQDKRDELLETILQQHRRDIENRTAWSQAHVGYDDMFRGKVADREGPFPGSANLHVQMPYWLIDAYDTRLLAGIWNQIPLVSGQAEEEDDQEVFRRAAQVVDWHLQQRRSGIRDAWRRASKVRCTHGTGVILGTYARDEYTYPVLSADGQPQYAKNPDGTPQIDNETGELIETQPQKLEYKKGTRYDGTVFHPLEWDDILVPMKDGTNLQPRSPSNPNGLDRVAVRQWQSLDQIWKYKDSYYPNIVEDREASDRQWWIDAAPAQDRSGASTSGENQTRVRSQDRHEGRQRNQETRTTPKARPNPEFEILWEFRPWEIDGETVEMVFITCIKPQFLLGAFRLSSIHWKERRPLIELHFQTVGASRWYSMGIPEIVKHLSAELDTIHNLRLDVGFCTNMPFFFYQATGSFDPDQIVLRPLKGVPVDNVNDVRFPQLQNVTSFFEREEQLLYTLVERVMGVTDLFLGMSPTQGAAARHATGFVGTQQEALARTSKILAQDAESFSDLCNLIYDLEIQYGPAERFMRLAGQETPQTQKITRQDLWMRGQYDFRLGANAGSFSAQLEEQKATKLLQLAQVSPLINQDPGRRWETEHAYLQAVGYQRPSLYIGPKDAVASGTPTAADEENGQMDQFVYGVDRPAPVHPSDNDQEHFQEHINHIQSETFRAMGSPNLAGQLQHLQMHQQQTAQKQAQMQAQAAQAAQQPPGGAAPPSSPPGGQDRIMPQLLNVGQVGQMGQLPVPAEQNGDMPTMGAIT